MFSSHLLKLSQRTLLGYGAVLAETKHWNLYIGLKMHKLQPSHILSIYLFKFAISVLNGLYTKLTCSTRRMHAQKCSEVTCGNVSSYKINAYTSYRRRVKQRCVHSSFSKAHFCRNLVLQTYSIILILNQF